MSVKCVLDKIVLHKFKILSILYYFILVYCTLLWSQRGNGFNYRSEVNFDLFSQKILKYSKFGCLGDLDKFYFILEILLNLFLFVPFSASFFLLGGRLSGFFQCFVILAIVLAIESSQYIFNIGVFDVDDIILNIFGGFVGVYIFGYFDNSE